MLYELVMPPTKHPPDFGKRFRKHNVFFLAEYFYFPRKCKEAFRRVEHRNRALYIG